MPEGVGRVDPTFYQLCTAAVADFAEHGYDSEHRLETWLARLREAAAREMVPEQVAVGQIRESLTAIYRRLVERGSIMARHPGVARFTLERVRPALRSELDRRILASAKLIKINREEAIERTLRRFTGWATSVPAGGSETVAKLKVKSDVRRSLAGLGFVERRVAIDQGHKLASSLNEILAVDGGALAARWHQHYTRYPRKDHTERDGRVYAIRGNWAMGRGLMRATNGYTDQITKPGEEVLCRCTYEYLHALRRLPDDMVTDAGRVELERRAA